MERNFLNLSWQTTVFLYLVTQDLARTEIDVTHDHILTLISYAGCGASSLFLGITLMTYLTLE